MDEQGHYEHWRALLAMGCPSKSQQQSTRKQQPAESAEVDLLVIHMQQAALQLRGVTQRFPSPASAVGHIKLFNEFVALHLQAALNFQRTSGGRHALWPDGPLDPKIWARGRALELNPKAKSKKSPKKERMSSLANKRVYAMSSDNEELGSPKTKKRKVKRKAADDSPSQKRRKASDKATIAKPQPSFW